MLLTKSNYQHFNRSSY